MVKVCHEHGQIEWPVASINCPICGVELEVYADQVEAGLSLPAAVTPGKAKRASFPQSLFGFDEYPLGD